MHHPVPPKQADINAFLLWIRTVYKAGSVIPKIADILAEVLIVLFSLFLVLKIIAATAPNCRHHHCRKQEISSAFCQIF